MRRVRIPEEMDNPHLNAGAHQHALKSLACANRLLGIDHAVRRALDRAVRPTASLLDLGCGGGALLKWLDRTDAGLRKLVGVDRSEFALRLAAKGMPGGAWIVADVRRLPLVAGSIDVVVCTLLLHHFDPDDVVAVLAEAARVARFAVLVSDLTRSRTAWIATWLVTRLLSRSWVFHIDGPRSVRAAYTPPEMQALARRANLQDATVTRQFPFRMLLLWSKSQTALGNDHAL